MRPIRRRFASRIPCLVETVRGGLAFRHWPHHECGTQISYDGVDIRKLSPSGSRGLVLLLYLALDDSDDRPLIIDQPEENLDPKSVFDELVTLFDRG